MAKRKPTKPAANVATAEPWLEATVTTSDISRFGPPAQVAALVSAAVQWVGIASKFVAKKEAGCTLRLYRRARGNTDGRGMKVKGRARNEYLRDTRLLGKSAVYAGKGDCEEVEDHPVLTLVEHPNQWEHGPDYWTRHYWSKCLTGNAYGLAVGAQAVDQLLFLFPQWVTVRPSETDFIAHYDYGREWGGEATFAAPDVLHDVHTRSLSNPYMGTGPLHDVYVEGEIYRAAVQYELASMVNGMRPSDIGIAVKEGTTDAQIKQIQAQLRRDHRGPRKGGEPLIVRDGTFFPLNRTNKDMEYREGQKAVRDIILAAFGVPLAMVTKADAQIQVGGSSAVFASQTQFYRDTVLPSINATAQRLTTWLLPRFGLEPGEYWFVYDNPVPDDRAFMVDRNVKYVGAGIFSLNMALEEEGFDPFEGGDVRLPLVQAASMAMAAAHGTPTAEGETDQPQPDAPAEQLNGAQVTALADLASQVAAGTLPIETARAIAAAAFPSIAPETLASIFGPLATFEPPQSEPAAPAPPPEPDDKSVLQSTMLFGVHHKAEKPMDSGPARDLARILDNYLRAAIPQVVSGIGPDGGLGITLGESEALSTAFARITERPFKDLWVAGYAQGVAALGEHRPDGMTAPVGFQDSAAGWLVDTQQQAFASVSETVSRDIRSAVAEGLSTGQTITEIQRSIMERVPELSAARAEVIARTESQQASWSAVREAWKDSGVVTGKRWILSGNPCPICQAMADQFGAGDGVSLDAPYIPLGGAITGTDGERYIMDYRAVQGPPAHPNCACGEEAVYE